MTHIEFEKFWDEMKHFGAATGRFETIARDKNREYLDRWQDYCVRKGFAQSDARWQARAEFFERCVKSGGGVTVPCLDPADFEPEMYRNRPYQPRPTKLAPMAEDDETRRVVAMTVRKMAHSWRTKKRDDYEPAPPTADEVLSDLMEKRDTPLAVSAALVSSIGPRRRSHDIAAE